MPINIIIPTALRQYADERTEMLVESRTVGQALDQLTRDFPELRRHLYNDQNCLRSFVNLYLNDEDIRHAEGPETTLKDGDTIMIVPSIAGGVVFKEG
jgi:molybdopterin converting factor small subunit